VKTGHEIKSVFRISVILTILRLSTLIQQAIQDHQQIISLYSE